MTHRPLPLTPRFISTIVGTFGDDGRAWLEQLPGLIAAFEQRWNITIGPAFPNLSYNYVAPATDASGAELVVKIGVPNPELKTEAEALKIYDGHGSVRLHDADLAGGVLLLERIIPGTMLVDLPDDAIATEIAADVMRQLWRPPPAEHAFPTVQRWSRALDTLRDRFDGGTGPLPENMVTLAQSLFAELFASMAEPVVLHGDLHHANILAAERQPWLAIDPKGIVGEPAYEVGALLHNPLPQLLAQPDPRRTLMRRVDILSERLGFDPQRMIAWGVAQAVLAACWSAEEGEAGNDFMRWTLAVAE